MDGSAVAPTAAESTWLASTIGALAATVSHLFIDIHTGLFGAAANVRAARELKNTPGRISPTLPSIVVLPIVLNFVLQAYLAL